MRPSRRSRTVVLAVTLGLLAATLPQAAFAAPPTLTTTPVAAGLQIPWDVAFLPNGQMLVTERAGRVRVYNGGVASASLLCTVTIPNVRAQGEAGLMGIVVDVDYGSNPYVYVCASREYAGSSGWRNQVLRYQIASNTQWINETILISNAEANTIHNGCALEMDRFGKLWVTMGDAANMALAQNRNSLNGKILRINRDGSIPGDNPVISGARNQVYSMGHRNPQGIAFRPGTDQVYAAEHGPEPAHGDEAEILLQTFIEGLEMELRAAEPVHEEDRRPLSALHIVDAIAVDLDIFAGRGHQSPRHGRDAPGSEDMIERDREPGRDRRAEDRRKDRAERHASLEPARYSAGSRASLRMSGVPPTRLLQKLTLRNGLSRVNVLSGKKWNQR
jgi:hypothetical protein